MVREISLLQFQSSGIAGPVLQPAHAFNPLSPEPLIPNGFVCFVSADQENGAHLKRL